MPTASPTDLAAWLIGCFAAVAMINQGLKLADRVKGKPPASELAGKNDALSKRVEELEGERREHDESRRLIYVQIEKVRLELKSDIEKVDTKVDQIPNEVIVLLKNTGALRK